MLGSLDYFDRLLSAHFTHFALWHTLKYFLMACPIPINKSMSSMSYPNAQGNIWNVLWSVRSPPPLTGPPPRQTRAERRGDDLVINGQKMWITNGCQADWICLLANTNSGPPHRSKSLICVPMDTKGRCAAALAGGAVRGRLSGTGQESWWKLGYKVGRNRIGSQIYRLSWI